MTQPKAPRSATAGLTLDDLPAIMDLDDAAARAKALEIWRAINLRNLVENILPTRQRADLILTKGKDHRVTEVKLRKL